MKKIILLCTLLILIPLAIFAQEIPPPPSGWGDVIMNPQQWFVSFAAISVLTAFISTFFNGLLKVEKKFLRQLVAWGVGILLVLGSDLINFGYAKDFTLIVAIINGLGAGLAANGVFDIPIIKSILNAIEALLNPKRE